LRWRPIALSSIAWLACSAEADRPLCEPGVPCASASEALCAYGREARLHGRAAFADGTCVASDDATCSAASITCGLWGQCHAGQRSAAPPASGCAAKTDRDFQASRDPACSAGTCVATGDDCRQAGICRLEGRCTAKDGVCVPDAASCSASEFCRSLGWCTLVTGKRQGSPAGPWCRAGSAADCQRAARCRDHGECTFAGGECVTCLRSPDCRQNGLCGRVGNACRATKPEHCAAAVACKRDGRCRLFQGNCVK
jgi:hypothetical protein